MTAARTRKRGVSALLLAGLVVASLALVSYSWMHANLRPEGEAAGAVDAKRAEPGATAQGEEIQEPATGEPKPRDEEPPLDVKATVEDFRTSVQSEQEGEVEAEIFGEQATEERPGEYSILECRVKSFLKTGSPKDEVDVQIREVHFTARQAFIDENTGRMRLFDGVRAEGKDFDVVTEEVLYAITTGKLNSSAPVEMNRYGLDAEGNKFLAMNVTGTGLEVDLTLRKAVVLREPIATLFNMSENFMAGPISGDAGEEGRTLVVTADGPMVYEHPAQTVTFQDRVVATSGERTLESERLVVKFTTNEQTEQTEVTSVTAEGSVRLRHRDQEATGARLLWQNLTQAGVLSGSPARLTTPELAITAENLMLFRLNSRFQVEGPGRLVWTPPDEGRPQDQGDAEQRTQPPQGGAPATPMPLSPTDPVEVEWTGAMAYDLAERTAVFNGDVRAVQKEDSLLCDVLELLFAEESQALEQVTARGNVRASRPSEDGGSEAACEVGVWDFATGVVTLRAAQNGRLTVWSGDRKLVGSQVSFEDGGRRMLCHGPGELMLPGEPGENPGGNGDRTTARWQTSMEFEREPEPFADFRGKAEVVRPLQRMSGEALRIEFDENMDVVKITATKNALLEVRQPPQERGEQPPTGEEKPVRAPDKPALDLALPSVGAGATDWILRAHTIIVEPQKDLLSAQGPGVLELLYPDRPRDTIRWTKGMTADFGKSFALFEGEVDADFSGSALKCHKLRLEFNEQRELRHVFADQDVWFRTAAEDAWELQADSAHAVFGPGGVLSQVIARSRELLEVRDAQRTVKCRLLTLFFEPDQEREQPVLSRAHASQKVSVDLGKDSDISASGDDLKWNRETDEYVLTGEPSTLQTRFGLAEGPEIVLSRSDAWVD